MGVLFGKFPENAMPKYMLVSFKTCPWVQRSAIVFREKKVDFELRHIEPDNRPDWFLAISPHKKVPALTVDDKVSLFESNAINEYLDETITPRLHPEDPIERAINRAWTDYVPTFASTVTATAYADTEADYNKAAEQIPVPFERLERALEKQGSGPFFNCAKFACGCRLCAVPAALLLSRSSQEAGPYREVSAAEGMDGDSARPALNAFFPAGRVRGDVSRRAQAPQQVDLAVHRARASRRRVAGAAAANPPLR